MIGQNIKKGISTHNTLETHNNDTLNYKLKKWKKIKIKRIFCHISKCC